MARIYLDCNLKTIPQDQLAAELESIFQDIEDEINAGSDLVVLTDGNLTLPEGIARGDIIFKLERGEIQAGVYNGVDTIYASFGTITGAITDTQHGTRAGGNLHPDATTAISGFMSGADKTKLNRYKGDTSSAAPASTTEYPTDGDYGFHTDTVGGTYSLAKNLGGVIYTCPLT